MFNQTISRWFLKLANSVGYHSAENVKHWQMGSDCKSQMQIWQQSREDLYSVHFKLHKQFWLLGLNDKHKLSRQLTRFQQEISGTDWLPHRLKEF